MIMLPLEVQYMVLHHATKEPKRPATWIAYYINEIIGTDEFTYDDRIGGKE